MSAFIRILAWTFSIPRSHLHCVEFVSANIFDFYLISAFLVYTCYHVCACAHACHWEFTNITRSRLCNSRSESHTHTHKFHDRFQRDAHHESNINQCDRNKCTTGKPISVLMYRCNCFTATYTSFVWYLNTELKLRHHMWKPAQTKTTDKSVAHVFCCVR